MHQKQVPSGALESGHVPAGASVPSLLYLVSGAAFWDFDVGLKQTIKLVVSVELHVT